MTDPQTPATEAGRRLDDWLTFVRERRGLKGVPTTASILAIEAEARAEYLVAAADEGYRRGRADALREAADAIEAEIAVTYDRTLTAETVEAAKALHEVLDRLRALHAILDPEAAP